MTSAVSPKGFAFGLFFRETTHKTWHWEIGDFQSDDISPHALYDLGCTLEERLLLAQGVTLNVFPIDEVTRVLRGYDEILRIISQSEELEQHNPRFPDFTDSSELVAQTEDLMDDSTFQSAIWSRWSKQHPFKAKLLFGTDMMWNDLLKDAGDALESALGGHIPADDTYFYSDYDFNFLLLDDIFDAILSCDELLASKFHGCPSSSLTSKFHGCPSSSLMSVDRASGVLIPVGR